MFSHCALWQSHPTRSICYSFFDDSCFDRFPCLLLSFSVTRYQFGCGNVKICPNSFETWFVIDRSRSGPVQGICHISVTATVKATVAFTNGTSFSERADFVSLTMHWKALSLIPVRSMRCSSERWVGSDDLWIFWWSSQGHLFVNGHTWKCWLFVW